MPHNGVPDRWAAQTWRAPCRRCRRHPLRRHRASARVRRNTPCERRPALSMASENGRRKSPMRGERRSAAMPLPAQDGNAATPQLVMALTCLVQANGGPTRLLSALFVRLESRHRRAFPYRQSAQAPARWLSTSHRQPHLQWPARCHRQRCRRHLAFKSTGRGSAVPESCA